ncbi:Tas retrotransposon peptidase A16 [Trichostrongylus colubriformis]|uniref:Tas retrotransposon peptidase A16 n=1 Tax=Trichostrongylus colubriformis TaxID=6319 RepID=A0AAN8G4V6_TRICO
MEALFNAIEDVLSEEEMMNLYVSQTKKSFKSQENICMFCKGEHKPSFCTTYKTPSERAKYLRDQRLCQLCASPHHKSSECKRKNCFKCGGPHHSSSCFKTSPAASEVQGKPQQAQDMLLKKTDDRTKKNAKLTQKVNVVAGEEPVEESEAAILQVQSDQDVHSTTFLPIGEIQVVDNKKGNLRNVPVLLDTGAEISFINNTLAQELQLPTISETTLLLHTFGSEEVQRKKCRIVQVQVRDIEENYHELELVTHDVLTKPMRCARLLEEDVQFIESLNLPVTFGKKGKQTQPLILLGCDQADVYMGDKFLECKLAKKLKDGTSIGL